MASPTTAEPLGKPVSGPALLCFKYSTFQLLKDELVIGMTGSAEGMRLEIEGSKGEYEIGESEIFAEPKSQRQLVLRHDDTSVYRMVGARRYAIYGPTSFSHDKARLVLWLSGTAVRGDKADAQIYQRLNVGNTTAANCSHTFTYSWDLFLGH